MNTVDIEVQNEIVLDNDLVPFAINLSEVIVEIEESQTCEYGTSKTSNDL